MDLRDLGRRYGDIVLAVVLAVTMTVELALWRGPSPNGGLAYGLLATVPLALRRRSPVASFLLVFLGLMLLVRMVPGFDNDSLTFIVVFFVTLYSLGRHTRGHEIWLGALGVLAFIVTFIVGDSAGQAIDVGDVAFATGFVGAPWAAGLTVRLRREREATLTARNEQLRREQEAHAAAAVAAERARIARELHDVVSHAISVTVLQARGGRRMLGKDEQAVRRSLDAIEHTNTQALGDMRRLLAILRDTEGDTSTSPQPSLARLDTLIDDVRRSGLSVVLETSGENRDVPPGVDLSTYRIIQEALTNVLKHAGAATATVRLEYRPDALTVSISDDGTRPVNGNGGGHGLIGIRERVAVVGGEVETGPGERGGFVVRARLPYAVDA